MKDQQGDTLRRILDAATEVFAEVGFAGARVDEIAKRAAVNKAALYYHIGGKEELYAEVLRDLLGNPAEQSIQEIKATASPEEKLKVYIRHIGRAVKHSPAIPPIMLREVASGGEHISEYVIQRLTGLVGTLAEILEEGRQQGFFIDAAPVAVHFMIVGAIMFLQAKLSLMNQNVTHANAIKAMDTLLPEDVAAEVEMLILRAVKT